MLRKIVGSMVILAMAGVGAAQAQVPVSVELRGGAAFPTADFGDASLKTGGGAGFALNYRFMPHLAVFGGWDWMRFTTDTPFRGAGYDVENTGYAFGLIFDHPVAGNVSSWLRGGALYGHVELENAAGDLVADSGHELGWEVGGGVRVPLTERLSLTPGVRYRTLSADIAVGQATVPVDLAYVMAEIGLQFRFGPRPTAAALVR